MKRIDTTNNGNQKDSDLNEKLLKLKSENAYLQNVVLQQKAKIEELNDEFIRVNDGYIAIQNSFFGELPSPQDL